MKDDINRLWNLDFAAPEKTKYGGYKVAESACSS